MVDSVENLRFDSSSAVMSTEQKLEDLLNSKMDGLREEMMDKIGQLYQVRDEDHEWTDMCYKIEIHQKLIYLR